MRIAFVSDAVYPYNKGGKEKRLHEISTRLAAMGHEVTIYCMHWWGGPETSRMEDGVRLQAVSKLYPLYVGDKRSIKEGVMFGLACWRLLRYDYDVIDVDHMPFFPVFSTKLVSLLKRKRLFGTWHEALTLADWTKYMGKAGYVAAAIERTSVRLPHTISAASEHTRGLMASELKRDKRVELVTSGIDTAAIARVRPSDEVVDVLFVGRLVKDKNAALLIDAIAVLKESLPEVRCMIVGSGIEHDNLQSQIERLGLHDNVRLAGNLPHATDIYAVMKTAKVFALPSYREGFGIVVLEALACGTPVVTIDSPANAAKSLIHVNYNGSVVPAEANALADALHEWIENDVDGEAIAREVVKFDWANIARHQAEVYALDAKP